MNKETFRSSNTRDVAKNCFAFRSISFIKINKYIANVELHEPLAAFSFQFGFFRPTLGLSA